MGRAECRHSRGASPGHFRMSMSAPTYRFLNAELQTEQRLLNVNGRDCQVGARAFDLLLALVERRDRVVLKSELLELVWPRIVVEENNLPVQVGSLRKLLGPHAIATIPGRGYRFVAPLIEPAVVLAEYGHLALTDSPTHGAAQASAPPSADRVTTRSTLVGRADELALLATMLDAHRLVTVVGAGGIGKSRLAQAVSAGQARALRRQRVADRAGRTRRSVAARPCRRAASRRGPSRARRLRADARHRARESPHAARS